MDRMMLSDDLRLLAMRLFNEGKTDRFASQATLEAFRTSCGAYPHLPRLFMAIQLEVALADGAVNRQEEAALLQVCDQLEFSRYEFFGIKARMETEQRFGGLGGHARPRNHSGQYRHEDRRQQRPQSNSLGHRSEIQEAYAVLQLRTTSTEAEIKKAYRRLISRHHPDKLEGMGHGSESLQRATEMTQKIQRAYDLICKMRGF
jgi:DnaJ like chaperone protein